MKKVLLLLWICFSISAFSQSNRLNLGIFTSENELIKSACDSALFILRQDYIMRDTSNNKDYTLNNQKFFGRIYTLAFLADSILWTDAKIFTPWVGDTNYEYYHNRYSLIPVLTELSCRPFYSKQFEKIEITKVGLENNVDSILKENAFVLLKQSKYTKQYLKPIFNTTDNKGWALIAYTEEKINKCDTCDIKLAIFKPNPDFTNNGIFTRQPDIPNIIGGVYLLPDVKTGIINFYVAGVTRKILNWFVKPLIDIKANKNIPANVLTPIINVEKEKERNKNPKNKSNKK